MQRASFTVKSSLGIAYDANHLAIVQTHTSANDGLSSMLVFVCSGSLTQIPASEVESVMFHPAGATRCSMCDQSIDSLTGAGIHANPVGPGKVGGEAA